MLSLRDAGAHRPGPEGTDDGRRGIHPTAGGSSYRSCLTGVGAWSGPPCAISSDMYGVLLALMLFTATVDPFIVEQGPFDPPANPFERAPIDPRLQEPLRLLSEVKDRDGQAIGQEYSTLVQALHLTWEVGPLRTGLAGNYNIPSRTVTVA